MRQQKTGWGRARPPNHRQPGGRRLRAEALEPRRMLVTLTIITPDEGGIFPDWAYDLATAIVAKNGVLDARDFDSNGIVDFVQKSRFEYGKQFPIYDTFSFSQDVMLLDWSAVSSQPGIADDGQLAQYFRDAIAHRLPTRVEPTHDLHLIGHGRGALLNMGILQVLADQPTGYRIGHVQVTTLDAYAKGEETLFWNPGGLVDFVDNYYQTSGPRQGTSLDFALNFDLSAQLNAWSGRTSDGSEHEEVHDWYYWTVASGANSANNPALKDAGMSAPSAAERTLLYNDYIADLNADGQPDDFRDGARIGFYFTVNGGGIGHALNVDTDIFTVIYTFDVRTGELPLYLGWLYAEDAAQITYAPTGDLYVTGDDLQFAESPMYWSDELGPWRTLVEKGEPWGPSAPFARRFSRGGRLAHAVGDSLAEIDPATTAISLQLSLGWDQDTNRTLAFDINDDLYLLRVPAAGGLSQVIRFDTGNYIPRTLGEIPYDDVISTTVIDGMLYCFRENGAYFSVNLTTLQVIERGHLEIPADHSLASVTSTMSTQQARWHNRERRNDVTGDGRVNSSDALAIINTLLLDGSRPLFWAAYFTHYYDVTNDRRVNTSDVLSVINQILLGSEASAPAAAEPQVAAEAAQPLTQPVAATSTHHAYDWIAFAASLELDSDDESELGWLT